MYLSLKKINAKPRKIKFEAFPENPKKLDEAGLRVRKREKNSKKKKGKERAYKSPEKQKLSIRQIRT